MSGVKLKKHTNKQKQGLKKPCLDSNSASVLSGHVIFRKLFKLSRFHFAHL